MFLKTCISSLSGQNSRLLKITIRELLSKIIEPYKSMTKKKVNTAIKKCYKRSLVAEDLINNPTCTAKYELQTFEILRQCLNNFNLI